MQPSSTKIEKNEIPTIYPGYDGKAKKPSHATVPLSGPSPAPHSAKMGEHPHGNREKKE